PFPYTLIIPPESVTRRHFSGAQLISVLPDRLIVLQQTLRDAVRKEIPFRDIIYCETGSILLYSWIKIVTQSDTIVIPYNTVNNIIIEPIIASIRGLKDENASSYFEREASKFDYLFPIDYKYGSFGRDAVFPDGIVLKILYECEHPDWSIRMFGRNFLRRCRTSHLAILTDKEIILIKETEPVRWETFSQYGKVVQRIPYTSVRCISIFNSDEFSVLKLSFKGGEPLKVRYSNDNRDLTDFAEAAAKAIPCDLEIQPVSANENIA
ncbi:MAG TPA: hypothetical protein VF857_02490, partial [Spirochaetota bacterium]